MELEKGSKTETYMQLKDVLLLVLLPLVLLSLLPSIQVIIFSPGTRLHQRIYLWIQNLIYESINQLSKKL